MTDAGGTALREEDFLTAFNRRVFAFLVQCTAEHGHFDIGYLGEVFTDEEIGRITGMQIARTKLTQNDMAVISDNVAVLRAEGIREKQNSSEATTEDLQNLINRRRGS